MSATANPEGDAVRPLAGERPSTGKARPVVLAAPSGTGKTTIARRLVDGSGEFVFSVSATTRPVRPGERHGADYEFLDEAAFRRMIEAGDLVEWAEVHGHLYGTPHRNIEDAAVRGEHVVLDIDVQGARQIRERVPDAVLVFILPPSARTLVDRLSGRGTEGRAEVVRRLRNALGELGQAGGFDWAVVNEDLETALDTVRALARGERPAGAIPAAEVDAEVTQLRAEIERILAEELA